jgi:pyruvate dehydrogenase E1 component alpha subunit
MHGHGAHDDMRYVPKEMHAEWARRDPIERYANRLVEGHGLTREEVERIDSEVRSYVDECAKRALDSPMPDPSQATDGVFADAVEPLGDGNAPWSRWAGDHAGNGAAPSERRAA